MSKMKRNSAAASAQEPAEPRAEMELPPSQGDPSALGAPLASAQPHSISDIPGVVVSERVYPPRFDVADDPAPRLAPPMPDRHGWRFLSPLQWALLVAILIVCGVTRFLNLGERPIMHDESLFVYYTEYQMHREWSYKYLPILHGPAHLMYQNIIFHLFGSSDYSLRFGIALLGFCGLAWFWALRRSLGPTGMLAAMAFYTVSPGLMFYQRFFREDGLFMFITLWVIASMVRWWQTKSAAWAMSFLFAATMLFCNKESSVFIYFSILTFFVLLVVHDLGAWILRDRQGRPRPGLVAPAPRFKHPVLFAFLTVAFVALVLTRVVEGIRFDADVIQAVGQDREWPFRDIRSIPLALGHKPAMPEAGLIGQPTFWRWFYILLIAGSLTFFYGVKVAVETRAGENAFLSRFWDGVVERRWWILGSLALCFALYLAIFTTFFTNPLGPFQIYKMTLGYWAGQNEWHRIKGPFHMHVVNLLIYELPLVIALLVGWGIGTAKVLWNRVSPVSLLLVAAAFLVFHFGLFRRLEHDMLYFGVLAAASAGLGMVLIFHPRLGRVLYPLALALFFAYSWAYFSGPEFEAFLSNPVVKKGIQKAATGVVYLDDHISLTHGFHLFLIAFLVLVGTVLTWDKIDRGEWFHAFAIWWLITNIGATSYAREKVPWVGIHLSIPLAILMGIYAQKVIASRRIHRVGLGALAALLALALSWQFLNARRLSFENDWDPRERLIFSMTSHDLKHHADAVLRYKEVASLRDNLVPFQNKPGKNAIAEWQTFYNEPIREKQVRVYVKAEPTIWPLRWYLRDVDWTEWLEPQQAVDQNYEFLFVSREHLDKTPQIREKYHVAAGRGRMFWTPQVLEWEKLNDAWLLLMPGQYLNTDSGLRSRADASKTEWKKIKMALLHRHTFDREDAHWPTVSYAEYYFCRRKDLMPY